MFHFNWFVFPEVCLKPPHFDSTLVEGLCVSAEFLFFFEQLAQVFAIRFVLLSLGSCLCSHSLSTVGAVNNLLDDAVKHTLNLRLALSIFAFCHL